MRRRHRVRRPADRLSRDFHRADPARVQCLARVRPGRAARHDRGLPSFARSCRMITIDFEKSEVTVDDGSGAVTYRLGAPEAFAAVYRAWLRAGWDAKDVYSFSG